jgi:peptidoglycan/xylan/chitin deacetylase (PgdA/CDA1 family)
MWRNVSIATYHDISDENSPFTSQLQLSTRPEVFRRHVAYFARNFDFIGVDELLAGELPRKPLLLTFDDAYRSVLTVAAPILKEVNAPSIFFVIPSVVQGKSLPIDNVLSLAVENMGPSRVLGLMKLNEASAKSVAEMISRFVANMRQDDIVSIKARIFSALRITEDAARRATEKFLNWTDIRKLAEYRVEVGNHSMTHSHFRRLSRNEIQFEIGQSRCELQNLSGQHVRCLSIPYGNQLDATHDVLNFARASGHQAIFLVHARSNRFRPYEDTYYRVSLRNERTWKVGMEIKLLPIVRSIYNGLTVRRLSNPIGSSDLGEAH